MRKPSFRACWWCAPEGPNLGSRAAKYGGGGGFKRTRGVSWSGTCPSFFVLFFCPFFVSLFFVHFLLSFEQKESLSVLKGPYICLSPREVRLLSLFVHFCVLLLFFLCPDFNSPFLSFPWIFSDLRLGGPPVRPTFSQRAQIFKKHSGFKSTDDWNFQARLKRMTFSSEVENFKRTTHQTPIFVGNSRGQDWNFQARLKFSSEIENFKRKLEIFKRSSEIGFFQDSGPLGFSLTWNTEFPRILRHFPGGFRRRKTVTTAGRSYGGPFEKFVGGLGGIFRSCPPTSQRLPLCGNHQMQRILGQLLGSLLQNPWNSSEVAPEVSIRLLSVSRVTVWCPQLVFWGERWRWYVEQRWPSSIRF